MTCSEAAGCSNSTTYADFAPTFTLSGSVRAPIYAGELPVGVEKSQTQTLEVSFYTAGPARPGYLDLSYDGVADGDYGFGPGFYAVGSVVGLYSWACTALSCNHHVLLPVTLGGEIVIRISARSVWGRVWYQVYYGGAGGVEFTAAVRDGSITGPHVLLSSSAPEPAWQALGGMLLVAGVGFWRKRGRGSRCGMLA